MNIDEIRDMLKGPIGIPVAAAIRHLLAELESRDKEIARLREKGTPEQRLANIRLKAAQGEIEELKEQILILNAGIARTVELLVADFPCPKDSDCIETCPKPDNCNGDEDYEKCWIKYAMGGE